MNEKKLCKFCGCELEEEIIEATPVMKRAWKKEYEKFYSGKVIDGNFTCVRYKCKNGEPSHEDYAEMLWEK